MPRCRLCDGEDWIGTRMIRVSETSTWKRRMGKKKDEREREEHTEPCKETFPSPRLSSIKKTKEKVDRSGITTKKMGEGNKNEAPERAARSKREPCVCPQRSRGDRRSRNIFGSRDPRRSPSFADDHVSGRLSLILDTPLSDVSRQSSLPRPFLRLRPLSRLRNAT